MGIGILIMVIGSLIYKRDSTKNISQVYIRVKKMKKDQDLEPYFHFYLTNMNV
jgi:hypothetical protein